jgi:hypothetical protein
VRLDADDGEARNPSVSAAGDGHALVVWQQRSSNYDVRASRFDPGAGTWGSPSVIDAAAATAESPQVAVSTTGTGVVIWDQLMGSWYELLGAYHPM